MTYQNQADIAGSQSMYARVAQCAAEQKIEQPDMWASNNRRIWAAAPGWADAWASALAGHPVDPEDPSAESYDPGKDEAVITDGMILAQVQSMILPAA